MAGEHKTHRYYSFLIIILFIIIFFNYYFHYYYVFLLLLYHLTAGKHKTHIIYQHIYFQNISQLIAALNKTKLNFFFLKCCHLKQDYS